MSRFNNKLVSFWKIISVITVKHVISIFILFTFILIILRDKSDLYLISEDFQSNVTFVDIRRKVPRWEQWNESKSKE